MRNLLAIGASFVIAGCVGLPEDEPVGSTVQAVAYVPPGHCPDPTDCLVLNGGGIYAEENGHLGMGSDEYVIARFVNKVDANGAPYVAWEGRSRVVGGGYGSNGGAILYAQYVGADGQTLQYNVTHVAEASSVPTFTLVSASDPAHPFNVSGDQLFNLSIIVSANIARSAFIEVLFFKPIPANVATATIYGTSQVQHRYGLFYYDGSSPDGSLTAVSYCQRAPQADGTRQDDYAVFQQGIAVDPLTAKTTFNQDQTVTVSCSGGAIATAAVWGYPYQTANRTLETAFQAAMHMKRASYCGDETSYTQAGTPIAIDDIIPIRSDSRITNANVEARWGRWPDGHIGALCVTPSRERHPGLLYPPTGYGLAFEGWCYPDDGAPAFQIPACPATGAPPATVISDSANLRVK